ncbi:MAG: TetR/AcrR family transcriptional regulator [Clostridia bacterium]|nr:TetR/AcrR family transcriptional regulator [Clostridia bacterium]
MTERFVEEDVKTRLLLSGIRELSEYGARDFSLRRAAEAAGVSCAAPYRYFKGKEEYVAEIISYLVSKWELMANEICSANEEGGSGLIAELAVTSIRFWLSNKNLRSALILSGEENSLVKPSVFDKRLAEELYKYFARKGLPECESKGRVNAIRALVIGFLTLVGSGELRNSEETFSDIKSQIEKFLRE